VQQSSVWDICKGLKLITVFGGVLGYYTAAAALVPAYR